MDVSQTHQAATLTGKVAVVSGSSSGIGAAIARELASRGAHVVVNYPFPNLRQQAEAVVASLSTPGTAVEADISTTTGPAQLVEGAVAAYGKIDILVNNAALAINLPFEEQTLEHWDKLVNLNGRGVFLLTQATLKHLTKGSGRIVNIVSVSSRGPPHADVVRWNERDGGLVHTLLGKGAPAEVWLHGECSESRPNDDGRVCGRRRGSHEDSAAGY